MDVAVIGGLALLALVDSTSFGTLGVPVWMLVQPRVRAVAVLAYVAVIAGFYWLLGLGLLLGAQALTGVAASLSAWADSRPVTIAQLVVGVALFGASFAFTRKRGAARRARRGDRPTRMQRWTSRAVGADATVGTVSLVALGAGLVEAASMLPYLGAVGILTASVGTAASAGLLAAYVVVMVLPALALLGLRLAAHDRVRPVLERVHRWGERTKDEMLGWIFGIIGFLVAGDAFQRLQAMG
ncbi:GAP family protein [Knoellia sp. CPCC 206450]|uniref:GAP family protein n=1 Tax=Knoellia tibetensis TaxID=3404798 RepID=UPI003B43D52E